MKRSLVVLALALGTLALVTGLVGMLAPATHTATAGARLAAPIETVWAAVADLGATAGWSSEIETMQRIEPGPGELERWQVGAAWGASTMSVEERQPPRLQRTLLEAGPFSGRWTYVLEPAEGGGTELTLTEEGTIPNPFVRALMLFHDPTESMRRYLGELGAHLGVTVEAR